MATQKMKEERQAERKETEIHRETDRQIHIEIYRQRHTNRGVQTESYLQTESHR